MLPVAFRNVVRHGFHSVLLGALFALASLLFISGNSLLTYSNRMLRELFVDTITGDVVVAAETDESMSIFGANTPAIGEFIPMPLLPRRHLLEAEIRDLPGVTAVSPLVSGAALMDVDGFRRRVPLFGVEPESYFPLLQRIELVRGRFLNDSEQGVMLTETQARRIAGDTDTPLELGTEVLLTTGQDQRFRIRAVPLVGVFRYPVEMDYVSEIALIDAGTMRALNVIQERIVDTSAGLEGPRGAADVDDLFAAGDDDHEEESVGTGMTVDDVLARVQEAPDVPADQRSDTVGGAHFLILRGSDTAAIEEVAHRYGAQVLNWRQAAGQAALLALLLQILFNGGFVLFVFAVTLGAVNIVLISTYRRTREIGTLRAIGTEDHRIRLLLVTEHGVIGLFGWAAGLAGAAVLARTLAEREITVHNRLITMLLGGGTIGFPIDPGTVLISLVVVMVLSVAAVLAPVSHALRRPVVHAIREH